MAEMDGMYTSPVECYIGGDSLTADGWGVSVGLESGGLKGMLSHLLTQIIKFILHVGCSLKEIKATFYLSLLNLSKDNIAKCCCSDNIGKCIGLQAANFPVMFSSKMEL